MIGLKNWRHCFIQSEVKPRHSWKARETFACIFPRFASAPCNYFEFLMVHCIACVLWLARVIWFWFYNTQIENRSNAKRSNRNQMYPIVQLSLRLFELCLVSSIKTVGQIAGFFRLFQLSFVFRIHWVLEIQHRLFECTEMLKLLFRLLNIFIENIYE